MLVSCHKNTFITKVLAIVIGSQGKCLGLWDAGL